MVTAQNANSSATMQENTNTPAKKPRKSKPKAAAKTTEAAAADTTATTPKAPSKKRRMGRCDPNQQEQTDLSGTYTGKVTHGGQTMDATLTITGNDLKMESGTETHSGRITAVTTCGYTAAAVSMQGEGGQMSTHSLRAKKVGDRLTLTSVPGEPEKISFTTGGAGMKMPRRHKTKTKPAAPAATPTTPPQ
jgi:hypothetical protein